MFARRLLLFVAVAAVGALCALVFWRWSHAPVSATIAEKADNMPETHPAAHSPDVGSAKVTASPPLAPVADANGSRAGDGTGTPARETERESSMAADRLAARARPIHWHLSTQDSDLVWGSDHQVAWRGAASALVRNSMSPSAIGSSMLWQGSRAGAFAGHRVEFSAYLRTQDLRGGAALWLRADDAEGRVRTIAAEQLRLRGTAPWEKRTLVIDVPREAATLLFGVSSLGQGSVWMDDASLEVVAGNTPLVGDARAWPSGGMQINYSAAAFPAVPVNLDFEEVAEVSP